MPSEEDKLPVALYELSQLPQFESLLLFLADQGMEYFAEAPRTAEGKIAFETFSYANYFSRKTILNLQTHITRGERIVNPKKEEVDHAVDRHRGQRDRYGNVGWDTEPE